MADPQSREVLTELTTSSKLLVNNMILGNPTPVTLLTLKLLKYNRTNWRQLEAYFARRKPKQHVITLFPFILVC